ncbi:hypothetical protein KQX54_007059 [Cotesia glomerata]|uniref:THAP-type domain-containing protein n=1 Tax=Cotesia glomerata TaxID=32391 RepID=A0AAV7IZ19_COTGL|nr:hypothetical protein KQX54_007059 [Cotesia glomerata]
MVKKCAVKNCMSGSIAKRKMKLKQNNRPTALFQVPKCPSMLQKWNLALSQQLLPKNFVCELHFKEEDINKKFDRIILPNGDIYDIKSQI